MIQFKIIIISSFLFWMTAYNASAQKNNNDSMPLSLRLDRLENYVVNEKEAAPIRKSEMEKYVIDAIIKNNKDIEGSTDILKFIVFIGLPGTLIAIISLYISAIKKARKFVETKIENIVEKNREDLIKLIESQEFDTKLKTSKRILVLGHSDEVNAGLKPIMEKMGFQKLKFRTAAGYTPLQDYDLIVFNNVDGSFPQQLINEYIDKESNDHIAFVAYTNANLLRHEKLNFANSRFTLYHNILNTLKYSEVLKITY